MAKGAVRSDTPIDLSGRTLAKRAPTDKSDIPDRTEGSDTSDGGSMTDPEQVGSNRLMPRPPNPNPSVRKRELARERMRRWRERVATGRCLLRVEFDDLTLAQTLDPQ